MQVSLAWPSRVIPPESRSVEVEVTDRTGVLQSQILRRALGETQATFTVVAGPVTVVAQAYATEDATGTVLARAETTMDVAEGETTPVTLTLVPHILPEALQPFMVQLHLHAHSNHNASPRPASMQWHSRWAAATGTQVLWWSDHDGVFDQTQDNILRIDRGQVDPETLNVVGIGQGSRYPNLLQAQVTGGQARAEKVDQRLYMELRADPQEEFQSFSYEPQGEKGTVKSFYWARPISSGAFLDVEVERGPVSDEAQVEIQVDLAYHFKREVKQHHLIFRLVPPEAPSSTTPLDDRTVLVEVPTPDHRTTLPLDLLSPASLLTYGDDNTINRFRLVVKARRGASASATWGNVVLRSIYPEPQHQFQVMENLAQLYEREYSLQEHIGVESGERHTDRNPHMNAYLPDATLSVDLLIARRQQELTPEAWVQLIHDHEGLVSFNHIFGTEPAGYDQLLPPAERAARTSELAQMLVETRGFGADLYEAGYPARAGGDLRNYLDIWDVATANEVLMYGIGVNDSHGGRRLGKPWSQDMPYPFTTWIWASDPSSEALLEAMRQGRLFFGNPFLQWNGSLAFQVGTAIMGDRTTTGEDESPLLIQFDPVPPNAKMYLVQGLLQPGLTVEYLHRGTLIDPQNPPLLDTRRPCFVRLEVFLDQPAFFPQGEPLVFSNPVVLWNDG